MQKASASARGLKCLFRDKRGVSAIEFALLLPIFLVLFGATLDLGEGLMVKRRIQQIASTTSDIVAQESSWTSSSLTILLTGTASILEPFSSTALTIQVNVINISSSKTGTISWSYGYNTASLAGGTSSPVAIPTTIAESGIQLVSVTAQYDMTTAFTSLLSAITGVSSYHFHSSEIARPRVGDTVVLQ